MNIQEVINYIKEKKKTTIPDVQHKFSLPYSEVRQGFQKLQDEGKIKNADGLTFEWCLVDTQEDDDVDEVFFDDDDEDGVDKEDTWDVIKQRRQELMERLAKIAEEEDDEDDDDDEEYDEQDDVFIPAKLDDDSLDLDEDDDDADEANYAELQKVIEKRRKELMQRLVSEDCESKGEGNKSLNQEPQKLIEGFDYGNLNNIGQSIIMKLRWFNIRLVTKAIQVGRTKTRYVFDVVSPQTRINDIKCYADDIRVCIGADKIVNILVPYGNDRQVAVEVDNDYSLDSYCKKALLYWLKYHGGRASIASIQRGLGIGINRSGRILDELQKFNCVERLNASEPSTKPIHVTITHEDINVLFPKSMGWED